MVSKLQEANLQKVMTRIGAICLVTIGAWAAAVAVDGSRWRLMSQQLRTLQCCKRHALGLTLFQLATSSGIPCLSC